MVRTAAKAKKKTAITSGMSNMITKPASPNTSSSSSNIDFLSNPNANQSFSEDDSSTKSMFVGPQTDKAKKKYSSQPSISKQKPKPNRKQAKPTNRIDRMNRKIDQLRQSTDLLIPKASFQRYRIEFISILSKNHIFFVCRLVREIISDTSSDDLRVTGEALRALQTSAETFLTQLFEDSYLLTLHRHRLTLQPADIQITLYIRNPQGR